MTRFPFRSTLARTVLLAMVMLSCQLPAGASVGGIFNGRVVESDGLTPRAGVVVRLVDATGERSHPSAPTNEEGRFLIEGAPAGTYMLIANTDEGAYVAAEELLVEDGRNHPLQLALHGGRYAAQGSAGGSGAAGGSKSLPKAIKGVIAGILVLAAFFAFDSNTEDEASDPIPF